MVYNFCITKGVYFAIGTVPPVREQIAERIGTEIQILILTVEHYSSHYNYLPKTLFYLREILFLYYVAFLNLKMLITIFQKRKIFLAY